LRYPAGLRWRETVFCELETFSRAWDQARRRALDRLSEEARQVRADVVVGVHLRRGEHDWVNGTVDYSVSGTAIRSGGEPAAWPTLSDLSVQAYWRLAASGYEPAGLVATTAVMFVSVAGATRWRRLRTTTQNQELEELSRAFFAARDTVRARLRGQADANSGDGIVGVQFVHHVRREKFDLEAPPYYLTTPRGPRARWRIGKPRSRTYYVSEQERRGWVITMHGAGTAVRRRQAACCYPPETVLRLGPR
jgi:uncharacterized protein YbjQ (UPF0145 family)